MSLTTDLNLSFVPADFSNEYHQQQFIDLINHYMLDPMGGAEPFNEETKSQLLSGMKEQPSSFVLFVCSNQMIIGMATCFVNFSTFKARPYLNIHDVIVFKKYRGSGVGRKLLEKCISIAQERDYCKVTLEVRDDNYSAMHLYRSLDFKDTEPVMHFWTRSL